MGITASKNRKSSRKGRKVRSRFVKRIFNSLLKRFEKSLYFSLRPLRETKVLAKGAEFAKKLKSDFSVKKLYFAFFAFFARNKNKSEIQKILLDKGFDMISYRGNKKNI